MAFSRIALASVVLAASCVRTVRDSENRSQFNPSAAIGTVFTASAGDDPLAGLEVIPEPVQRRSAKLRVAIFQFRINRIPKLVKQAMHQLQAIVQSREALLIQ